MSSNFPPGIFNILEPTLATAITASLKVLLEEKHLYQKVEASPQALDTLLAEYAKSTPVAYIQDDLTRVYNYFDRLEWGIKGDVNPDRQIVNFTPPTIKLFCSKCKRIEPYNFVGGMDFFGRFARATGNTNFEDDTQLFVFAYQCQSCKLTPEVFFIRRYKAKLMQVGRTPIEQVNIPSVIPESQRKYFSDSIIAANSGQVLAGKFLLRTYIEQYVRSLSKNPTSQNIDELFAEYAQKLPSDFKQRFPSLYDVYARLSNDIHAADEKVDVFEKAQKDIEEHFDAKRLYKLVS